MELFLGMLSKSKSASEVHETLAPGVFEHEAGILHKDLN